MNPPRTTTPHVVGEYAPPARTMTADPKPPVPGWVVAALMTALAAGVAWGTATVTLAGKADASDLRQLDDRTQRVEHVLDRIDARVGEMYCGQVPAERRAGCR